MTVRRMTDRSGDKCTQETPLRLVTRHTTLRERQALGPQHGTPQEMTLLERPPSAFLLAYPPPRGAIVVPRASASGVSWADLRNGEGWDW